ncbi:hypothetical protein ACFL96_11070 [Thermoproteota archaeon]
MSKKSKKKKREPKPSQRNTQAVDERVKQVNAMAPPDENPWKMDNEKKLGRWRPLGQSDKLSISEKNRFDKRQNRLRKRKVLGAKK